MDEAGNTRGNVKNRTFILISISALLFGCASFGEDNSTTTGGLVGSDAVERIDCEKLDISGWTLTLGGRQVVVPDGHEVPIGSYLLFAVDADRDSFARYWETSLRDVTHFQSMGVSLNEASFVVLQDSFENVLDGPTPAFQPAQSVGRHASDQDRLLGWDAQSVNSATPGDGVGDVPFVQITEISDGTDNEEAMAFVEVYVGIDPNAPAECDAGPVPTRCESDAECVVSLRGPVCSPVNSTCGVDVSGARLFQSAEQYSYVVPPRTVVPAGTSIVFSPHDDRDSFANYWDFEFPSSAVFVSTEGEFPRIDGGEQFVSLPTGEATPSDPSAEMFVGNVIASEGPRHDWLNAAPTPGSCVGCDEHGVFLSEIGDSSEVGYGAFEYVELYVGRPRR
ncbi:MAG: hypothetical protein AAGF12_27180 [Myxococcota bacterium]